MMAFTWCKPRGREDGGGMAPLVAGDLLGVVGSWERGQLQDRKGLPLGGCPLAAIGLHPWLLSPDLAPPEFRRGMLARHGELAADIAELKGRGIEVVAGPGGCLSWEAWLYPAAGDGVKPPVDCGTPNAVSEDRADSAIVKGNTLSGGDFPTRRGPERLAVTAEAVLGLHRQGFGVKRIAAALGISHMTVVRRLREAEQGRML